MTEEGLCSDDSVASKASLIFQSVLKRLLSRGSYVAINSKNDFDQIKDVFQDPQSDFLVQWNDWSVNVLTGNRRA